MAGHSNEGRPSLITSVLGVMGRELQQFVLSAAGVNQVCHRSWAPRHTLNKAKLEINRSSSPVKDRSVYSKRRAPANEEFEERPRKRVKVEHPKRVARRSVSPGGYEENAFHHSRMIARAEAKHEEEVYERGSSPSLERGTSRGTKRGSLTMPGAFTDAEEEEDVRRHHVRFASGNIETPSQSSSPLPSSHQTTYINLKRNALLQESSYDTFSATPPPSTSDSEDYTTPHKTQKFVTEQEDDATQGDAAPGYKGQIFLSRPTEEPTLTFDNHQIDLSKSSTPRGTPETSLQDMRIAELEREVQRLKEELASRTVQIPLPPPPPPLPPPPPPPPHLRQAPSHGSDKHTSSLLTTARSTLKMAPISIHPTSSNLKTAPTSSHPAPSGLMPTVPADQMAAFLNEMKTVRLRKVGFRSKSPEARHRYPSSLRAHDRAVLKEDGQSQQARVNPTDASTLNRLTESRRGVGSDLTPSLCSDRGEVNEEDGLPSTPPALFLKPNAPVHRPSWGERSLPVTKLITTKQSQPDNKDAPLKANRRIGESPPVDTMQSKVIYFPQRAPTSYQLPNLSPNRPRPPGRTGNSATVVSHKGWGSNKPPSEDEVDPIALLPARISAQVIPPKSDKGIFLTSISEPQGGSLATGSISSLEHELRRIIRAEVEKEFEEELRELDNGERKRSKGQRERNRGAALTVENARDESPESPTRDVAYSNRRRR
ncbi:hypothetical protein FRC14_002611 [Serendipita sp. 396]|nr:hypothetical protein FRC14_002611 [Serendipita sp. 396]KAG8871331.1 hypothetical protein FRC20_010685 [Serendipita sp. 405]